ncbi:MAG TPA: glycosyltransferase family 39 protein [Blastocatellia bacterium]|nr:glycosyltransferase family 39 protein [Blastocatellia bacterium]
MQVTVGARQINESARSGGGLLIEGALLLSVLLVSALFFWPLFNRETTLSYSIGYNLYGAERVLSGEIPYRDFHTLYPPATVYLNAAIFKLLGTTLYNALLGVFIFKVLTTIMLYACGRMIMPRVWALFAAAASLLWLRPNGPFKAVPMHYGALFLACALFLVLRYLHSSRRLYLFGAGISLGALALFKHNIGAYALAGTSLLFLPVKKRDAGEVSSIGFSDLLILLGGFVLPVLPVVLYMASQDGLAAMTRTLVFGPGDFLLSRLAGWPSPVAFLLFSLAVAAAAILLYRLRPDARLAAFSLTAIALACISIVVFSGQSVIDGLIFYTPVGVIVSGAVITLIEIRRGDPRWRVSLSVLVIAAAAFFEAFPRFAREQAVASMPFVTLLLLYLAYLSAPLIERMTDALKGPDAWRRASSALLAVVLPLTVFLIGGRMFLSTYFDSRLHFKSDTELMTDRGRGVFFPEARAKEIDGAVSYIRERTREDDFFFAHAYAGSSYLFLADRNNPSGAQFWGGVGVTDSERAETLRALEERRVELIITTDRDLRAERYDPMREYIESNYRIDRQFGEAMMLERIK